MTGWLGWGGDIDRHNSTGRAGPFGKRWSLHLDGRVTAQPVVVRGVPSGQRTVYMVTSRGSVYAVSGAGSVRWRVRFGRLEHRCGFLDGYGVTGTPAVDADARILYVADAFGMLHALDLDDGDERPGWPVRAIADYRTEHVFGGLLVHRGSVYVPVATYCDVPAEGKLVRVQTANRRVNRWISVRLRLGGGGGIWGFGGAAFSRRRGSVYVATGNAYEGGENVRPRFREWVPYAERIVELSPTLELRASNHPPEITAPKDLDFSSGPVLAQPGGCPELAAAISKTGRLYAWRADRVRDGPAWRVQLSPKSFVSQPAWSPRHRSFYVTTGNVVARIVITRACRPRLAWSRKSQYAQGSPTVAGNLVWFGRFFGRGYLTAVDARSGRIRRNLLLTGTPLAAPAVLDGSLYAATFDGWAYGFVRG